MVFVVALGAGVTAGMLASRMPANSSTSGGAAEQQSWLTAQLGLTRDQSNRMREIWEDVSRTSHKCFDQANNLQSERDAEVTKFLTPEQIIQYNDVTKKYQDKAKALAAKRQAAFDEAVRQTMTLLKPDQQKRYDEILKERIGHGAGDSGALPTGPSSAQ